jgi:WD40 repeat protein
MNRTLSLVVCLAVVASFGSFALGQTLDEQIAALQKAADEAAALKTAGDPVVAAARANAKTLADALLMLKTDLSKGQNTEKDLTAKLPALQEAAKKALEAKAPAEQAAVAAAQAATDAKGKENEKATADAAVAAATALVTAVKAQLDAAKAVTDAEAAIAAAKALVAEQPAKITAAEQAVATFAPELQKAEDAYAALVKDAVDRKVALETLLVDNGRLISFRKQVAPIFADRCTACHNARMAKGRLNMETYANLLKGGESGDAVVAAKPGDSLIVTLMEDGSMPKDADPVTPEQIALVKKWIEMGAPLDAGVDAAAQLITIIPKPVQPNPPEAYRVAMPILAMAFSNDGSLLATAGYREVVLWNTANGQLVRRITNLTERIHDIEFSKDGTQLAVAAGTPGQLGEVKIFNVADGALSADLFTTDDEVFSVAYSPDGTKIAAACADRSVRIYEVSTRKRLLMVEDHADWVMDVAWSPDGNKLATASRDKTSKIFDAKTGEALGTFNGHGQPVFGVSFLADGASIATSGRDARIRIWNVADAKQARELAGFGSEVFRIVMSPDGHVFSGSADKQVRMHNLANAQVVRAYAGHNDWVYTVAYNPATKKLASGSHDGEVKIWNADDGKELVKFIAAPGLAQPVVAAQ